MPRIRNFVQPRGTRAGTTQQVTVQTPHVAGCRGSQAVEMKSGETAIMAARKPDGGWLVSFLTVTALRPTPQLFPVRR